MAHTLLSQAQAGEQTAKQPFLQENIVGIVGLPQSIFLVRIVRFGCIWMLRYHTILLVPSQLCFCLFCLARTHNMGAWWHVHLFVARAYKARVIARACTRPTSLSWGEQASRWSVPILARTTSYLWGGGTHRIYTCHHVICLPFLLN